MITLSISIAALLAGILIGHICHVARAKDQAEKLRQALWCVDFWREHCNNWHALAVANGAGRRKRVQRITVPDPPQAEIVTAGKVGLKVWRN